MLLGALWLGCAANEDLAALVVSSPPDGGVFEPGRPFDVIGRPWRGARPQRVAAWPLATPLGEFFADERGPGRAALSESEREALAALRAAVSAGDYGEPRTSVVVRDQGGDEYLVIFLVDAE